MIGTTRRRALLRRARRLRHREEGLEMTPDQRLAITRRLVELAAAAAPARPERGTDEPAEHWLRRSRAT
jgi:hypothetical protein